MGDKLLKSVTDKLRKYIRKDDTVSRSGGDEFTMLFTGVRHTKDVENMAKKIIEALHHPFVVENHELNITTSIGIAIYPKDGEDGETLLKNADTAMYQAKENGRDSYQCYNHTLHEKVSKKMLLDTKLRLALEKNQFVLYYQPLIDIDTEQIIGAEALLRWQHPDLGLVSPLDFISTAEGSGMIVPIGEWVLKTACLQIKEWQNAGLPPIQVSVNLSAQTFMRQNLIKVINQTLKQTGVSPHLLALEITESTIMKNIDSTVFKLEKLKESGVQTSIDDFGTGYSSLSYLKKFPIHTLKIDGSFIRDILSNQDDEAIVTAIIAMAKKLKLQVVAEGVETEEQLIFLRQQKCDMAQGYLISRPVPPEEFEKLMLKEATLAEK
jgi:predicted signal transduction protein with EAL and GGDEF domain